MDLAYDHIAEHQYGDGTQTPTPAKAAPSEPTDSVFVPKTDNPPASPPRQNLQTEFQETFKAFSNSAWGTKLGGFWGNVKKQGESYYEEARKEVGDLGVDALKELEGLRNKVVQVGAGRSRSDTVKAVPSGDGASAGATSDSQDTTLDENETFIARFKTEAAKRLKEVQKAEDAADEALLRFGTNVRNFLKDAVSVTAPEPSSSDQGASTEVLFESKDATTGKRVVHASRFDAQLHVIHTSPERFTRDPDEDGNQWEDFKKSFDVEKKTDAIASDLEKHKELRNTMEKLVPEQVEYKDFWSRYYFLRHIVETQEEKRREMLKASTAADEEVGWGDDSDDETEKKAASEPTAPPPVVTQSTHDSTTTLQQASGTSVEIDRLKLAEGRRSHDEKSVADSDASYDLVSGATSRAPGSPKDAKSKNEDSDEEDWE